MEALLLIPAASSRNLSRSLKGFFFYSVIFALISSLSGVMLPVLFDLPIPSGSAIILCVSILFFISALIRILGKNFRGAAI